MKNLWQNSRSLNIARFVWLREGTNDQLEMQNNPDLNSEEVVESGDPLGAAGSVSLETAEYGARVSDVLSERTADMAVTEERENYSRTPGNPMGILFGSKFERQWANPAYWVKLTLFSKDSILKNIGNSTDSVKEMMDDAVMLGTGVKAALFNESSKNALKVISQGKEGQLEKTDSATFEMMAKAVENSFDGALKDAVEEESLGQTALKSRENFRKIRDVSFWRESRHRGMLKVIKGNIQKAQLEVRANIQRGREHLKRQRENVINATEVYQAGMRNRNDSVAEGQFWGFVQGVIKNPALFLEGGTVGMINLNRVFGTTNKVKILDAIKFKFADKVIELERSQQLTLDQDTLIANMDHREKMTADALETTDYKGLFDALGNSSVQPFKKEQKLKDDEVLKALMIGLRRMGVEAKNDIFGDAPVGLKGSERMVLVLRFMAGHQELLTDQRCSLTFKQNLYTWMQRAHEEEDELLAQGATTESGTPAQRRYVLKGAVVIKDEANRAIDALDGMDAALRDKEPGPINQKLQAIESFLTAYRKFYGTNGAAILIDEMPDSEKSLLEGVMQFSSLNEEMKVIHESLETQRKDYDLEVLRKLPISDDRLREEKEKAERLVTAMEDNLGRDEAGINMSPDKYTSVQKARGEIFARVKEWEDAMDDVGRRAFKLPPESRSFAGDRMIGTGLQHALDAIPDDGVGHTDPDYVNGFNGLMRQRMQKSLQGEREGQFNNALKANMKYQMDNLLGRQNGMVTKAPEPGMTLDRLEVADVTYTDGELIFPESLQHREMFENLTLLRSAMQGTPGNAPTSVDMIYHNDTHIVQLREDGNKRVVAEAWKKPEAAHGNRNAVVRVPHTQPESKFVVLNMSTAGTRAATQATAGRRVA